MIRENWLPEFGPHWSWNRWSSGRGALVFRTQHWSLSTAGSRYSQAFSKSQHIPPSPLLVHLACPLKLSVSTFLVPLFYNLSLETVAHES